MDKKQMSKTSKKIVVTKSRQVKVWAELWHTSYCLYVNGFENPKGSCHQFRASLIFTAFALEAYLNHVGNKLFKEWKELERLSPKGKLIIIADKLEINIKYGHRPWQVLNKLIGFRNYNAHGKPEHTITNRCIYKIEDDVDKILGVLIMTEWEEYCDQNTTLRAREDVENIIKLLYSRCNIKNDYPFAPGIQISTAGLEK